MSATESINLAGKIRPIGRITFVRADIAHESATIYYALDGLEQPFGLRLDLNKRALLDTTGDPSVDNALPDIADLIIKAIQKPAPIRVGGVRHRGELDKSFEYQGVFWLPTETVVQSHGVLSYTPADGIKLNLSAPLESKQANPFSGAAANYETVFGQLMGGGIVTLLSSFVTQREFGFGDVGSLALVVNRCLFGAHVARPGDEVFNGVTLSVSALEAWIGASGFNNRWETTPDGRHVTVCTFTTPPARTIRVPSEDLVITIGVGLSEHEEVFKEVTLRQQASTTISSQVEGDLAKWLSTALKMQNLFCVLAGTGLPLREVSPQLSDRVLTSSFEKECALIVQPRVPSRREPKHPVEMVISLEIIGDRLEDVVQRWFLLSTKYQQVLDAFVSEAFYFDIPLESRFLALLSSLEIYHRLNGVDGIIDDQVFRGNVMQAVAGSLQSLDEAKREMLLGNFARANQYPLATRIRDLAAHFPQNFQNVLQLTEPLVTERIVEQRNWILHGNGQVGSHAAPRTLFWMVGRLRILLYSLILLELGFDPNTIAERIQNTGDFGWSLQQRFEPES